MRPLVDDLTSRQQDVLTFIAACLADNGYPPTLREVCQHLGIVGNAAALRHLDALERKGYLRRSTGRSRGIVLNSDAWPGSRGIPIVGTVRAGLPQLAVEDIEGHVALDPSQAKGGTFFLRVRGESMIEEGILDGDLALVCPQKTAENGDLVVALIDDEATLKRFYRQGAEIRLEPRNRTMAPILVPADRALTLVGKVVKIVRELA